MEKLTQLIQTLWSENKLSKEAYADLLNFTNENHTLQLLQTDVIKSVCEHKYMTDANWKWQTCQRCGDKITIDQTVL